MRRRRPLARMLCQSLGAVAVRPLARRLADRTLDRVRDAEAGHSVPRRLGHVVAAGARVQLHVGPGDGQAGDDDGADARFTLYEDNGRDQAYATDGAHATIDFAWDAARRLFTAGARVGAFDGMLDARTFNVVVVRPGDGADAPARGVGIAPEPRPDATLAYTGEAYSVTL